ncbi:MAG: putative ABC transporter permease [Smithella sp.]
MEKIELENLASDYKKIDIYCIFSYFIICAFIGWIFETTAVLIQTGHLTDRGLLFIQKNVGYYFPYLKSVPFIKNVPLVWGLPIIEIYGLGGIIIVFFLKKLKNKPFTLFFTGMILMTLFELMSSYFCSYVLHRTYWDYSKDFLNFQGRICLRSSLAWGLLSVLTVEFLISKLELIYAEERRIRHFKTIISIFIAYTFICVFFKIIYM